VRAPKDVARVAIEAIRAQGRLVSRGWADLALIDDRDDCFAVGEVNQQALFGRVAAVVHHGGAGTTTTATRAGAPHVVVPQGADQPYWAGRVADLGIGTAHDGPTPTTESLSAALRRLPEPFRAEEGKLCERLWGRQLRRLHVCSPVHAVVVETGLRRRCADGVGSGGGTGARPPLIAVAGAWAVATSSAMPRPMPSRSTPMSAAVS